MTPAEPAFADHAAADAPSARRRGTAFGLRVDSPLPLDGVGPASAPAPGRTRIELATPSELNRSWRARAAERVLERRQRNGSLTMAVDAHPELGYRVYAPRYGRHLVSGDGRQVLSALPQVVRWRWQRLLFAQVLPLAATLQGLELFHASGVELNGHALGFVAASGTGKTSVSVHLVAQGARLLTDDVLALEPTAEGVEAHPGGGLVNVAAEELKAVPEAVRPRIGSVLGRSDKVHLAANVVDRPFPLRSIYFLRREVKFSTLRIGECAPPDPLLLLSSGFISYVDSPERLTGQLDACSHIAAHVRMFEVETPAEQPAAGVAALIQVHDEVER